MDDWWDDLAEEIRWEWWLQQDAEEASLKEEARVRALEDAEDMLWDIQDRLN